MSYNMVLTLECKLVIRDSARLKNKEFFDSAKKSREEIPPFPSKYFEGKTVGEILSVEAFLQSCDYTDAKILLGLMNKKPIKTISEETFLGERAVRYRIENFIKQKGFKDRDDLISFLNSATENNYERNT